MPADAGCLLWETDGSILRPSDLELAAEQRFRQFVLTIQSLVLAQNIQFDLLVAGGNTGLVMADLTRRIYARLGLGAPRELLLPIYRYDPGFRDDPAHRFDNSCLWPEVEQAMRGCRALRNVLFVDDEIGLGITALTLLDFVQRWRREQLAADGFDYYVVAEDQGFEPRGGPPGVEVHFAPYAGEIDGWNNVIANIVPPKYTQPLEQVFPEATLPFHQRLNLLLNLPIKELVDGKPRYGSGPLEAARASIPALGDLQAGFQRWLDRKIRACLRQATTGPK